jgi:hypothetical protein
MIFSTIKISFSHMDVLVKQWHDARLALREVEDKIERIKAQVEGHMIRHHMDMYEDEYFKIRRQTQQRSVLLKKNVPAKIWDEYALPQRIEFLQLIEKKK